MFADFLNGCWNDHADDAEGVFARLAEGVDLAGEEAHLGQLAHLVAHVAGEHLGRWDEGLILVDRVEASPLYDPEGTWSAAIARSRGVLLWGAGRTAEAEALVPEGPGRGRMLAVAASALAGQGRIDEAATALDVAEAAAADGPGADDPLARALAITGNNLACALEEKADRSAAEIALMKRAARLGRTWWAIAGDWSNVMLAEVRLAFTHLAAGEPEIALGHALEGLALSDANGGAPDDRLAPLCVIAKARAAAGDAAAPEAIAAARACLAEASPQLQEWYTPVLADL
jgi:hypothetical protein